MDRSFASHHGNPVTDSVFSAAKIRAVDVLPPVNVTEIHMVVHHGTHFDAPRHFVEDGTTIDQVPLERLYGQGVIWRISKRRAAQSDGRSGARNAVNPAR